MLNYESECSRKLHVIAWPKASTSQARDLIRYEELREYFPVSP